MIKVSSHQVDKKWGFCSKASPRQMIITLRILHGFFQDWKFEKLWHWGVRVCRQKFLPLLDHRNFWTFRIFSKFFSKKSIFRRVCFILLKCIFACDTKNKLFCMHLSKIDLKQTLVKNSAILEIFAEGSHPSMSWLFRTPELGWSKRNFYIQMHSTLHKILIILSLN